MMSHLLWLGFVGWGCKSLKLDQMLYSRMFRPHSVCVGNYVLRCDVERTNSKDPILDRDLSESRRLGYGTNYWMDMCLLKEVPASALR